MDISILTHFIKSRAYQMGFEEVGISKADFLAEEAPALDQWLAQGMHGSMEYMERNYDKRLDPSLLVDGAKSVISLSYNYYSDEKQQDPTAPKISKYAYGEDYHEVIKEKLKLLLEEIKSKVGDISGRCFVDSAPVMERAWAKKSGLGWIGKNSLLLTKKKGSFFFLAELILDLDLVYDTVLSNDYCGSCTKCIDACPTDAIIEPYKVDGSKCISYFTIELKDAMIDTKMDGRFDNWMFGCDICQDVCPINARSKPNQEPKFKPSEELLSMSKDDWKEITEDVFKKVFLNSPVKRSKYNGLKRNIEFLKIE
jgi:epoxyqueuosine reductase